MDRHRTCKGLHEMGGISQQAFSRRPRLVACPARAVAAVYHPVLNLSPRVRAARLLATAANVVLSESHGRAWRGNRTRSRPSGPIPPVPLDWRWIISSTLQRVRVQRARFMAAFSPHRLGPNENAATTDGMPVRINDVRAKRKKRRRCFKPKHCHDGDLRFSSPHSSRFLHFLFQSARIGLGRSVKED